MLEIFLQGTAALHVLPSLSKVKAALGKARAHTATNRRTLDAKAQAWQEEDTDHALPEAEDAFAALRRWDEREEEEAHEAYHSREGGGGGP